MSTGYLRYIVNGKKLTSQGDNLSTCKFTFDKMVEDFDLSHIGLNVSEYAEGTVFAVLLMKRTKNKPRAPREVLVHYR